MVCRSPEVLTSVIPLEQRGLLEPPSRVALKIGPVLVSGPLGGPEESLELDARPRAVALSEVVKLGGRQATLLRVARYGVLDGFHGKANLVRVQVVRETLRPAERPVGEFGGSVVAPTEAAWRETPVLIHETSGAEVLDDGAPLVFTPTRVNERPRVRPATPSLPLLLVRRNLLTRESQQRVKFWEILAPVAKKPRNSHWAIVPPRGSYAGSDTTASREEDGSVDARSCR